MKYFLQATLLLVIFLSGCDTSTDESPTTKPDIGEMVEVRISSSHTTTRTEIDSDSNSRWSLGDKIALWAKSSIGSNDYTLSGETFTMRYYGESYDTAEFTSTISPMGEGVYNYYSSYPTPHSITNITRVSYDLQSITQNGFSGGDADIMVATPTQGIELSGSTLGGAELSFRHLMHAFRIEIPEGRNLFGMDIKRLNIEFPRGVIGSVSFDVSQSDTEVTYTDGSKSIDLDLECDFGEAGEYAWVFFNPGTLSGDITFTLYDQSGYRSQEISTTVSNLELKAGEITPLTLTAPAELTDRTTVTRQITANNLGEAITKVTFTAPDGGKFINGSNTWSFDVNDVPCECSVTFYPSVNDGNFDSGEISVEYESENVISPGSSIDVSGLTAQNDNISTDVIPCLMEENFTTAPSGWTMAGYSSSSLSSSGSALLSSYLSRSGIFWHSYTYSPSRMTSAALSKIKSGKTVSITVSFTSQWSKNKVNMSLSVGGATGTELDDAISGGGEIELSSSSTATTLTQDITDITKSSMIAWKNLPSGENSSGADNVYIDNVKVTIKTTTE